MKHPNQLPKSGRLVAILQLCFVFTAVLWIAGQPFMGELFAYKSATLVYQTVMGSQELLLKLDKEKAAILAPQFQRNRERFEQLPQTERETILTKYANLQELANQSWWSKTQAAWNILVFDLPPFERAWIVLSFVIPLLLLLGIEGARPAAWLLPIVTICYAFSNLLYGIPPKPSADASLFPSEEVLLTDYLHESLSPDLFSQQQQLIKGWQLYLIKEFAHETPSDDPVKYQEQVEDGEFAFNLKRVELMNPENLLDRTTLLHQKQPKLILLLYALWNVGLAYVVNKRKKDERDKRDLRDKRT